MKRKDPVAFERMEHSYNQASWIPYTQRFLAEQGLNLETLGK